MLGLAEHYSKIPQAQRKRTMVFVALDGQRSTTRSKTDGLLWARSSH